MKSKMKKTAAQILALILSCTVLFGLTACGGSAVDVDALNAQNETLTKQLNDANAEISDLEAEIARLKSLMEGSSDELLAEIAKLEALEEELRNCLKGIHAFSGSTCTTCGADRGYRRDDNFIYFGEYPQTLKADDVTITSTTDSHGYYLGSDGNYYAMVTADPYVDNMAADRTSKSTFSTGASVVEGTVYYFKVEPIRWRILKEENGEALLLCDSIIANMLYQTDYSYETSAGGYCTTSNGAPSGTYANNYKYSTVRAWLNETFYKAAFTSPQQGIVLTTDVDNGVASASPYGVNWNGGTNHYVCENTSDKLFLLSELEATNEAYGFASYITSDTARGMSTSDYSRATGAYMNTSDYHGNGWWWTRSPYYQESRTACLISDDGRALFPDDVAYYGVGVVPALRIKL